MQKRFASMFFALATLISLGTGTVAHALVGQLQGGTDASATTGAQGVVRDDQEGREGDKRVRPLQNSTTTPSRIKKGLDDDKFGMRMMIGHNLRGVVASVGINTLMVNTKVGSTTTTFTVDVSRARFFKDKATTTLSSILVNDTVLIMGPVTGTSVVATAVYAGKLSTIIHTIKEERKEIRKDRRDDKKADRMIGSGVAGIVSAMSGNIISVVGRIGTSTATTTYAVDATNAKFYKDKATTTISSIVIGDKVLVEGTVSGTSVTATAIYNGKLPFNGKVLSAQVEVGNRGGFMAKFGEFFKDLFRLGRDK